MDIYKFALGIIGITLSICSLSYLLSFSLEGIYGISTFWFAIFLVFLGGIIFYFSFYYKYKNKKYFFSNLKTYFKWGAVYTISTLIGIYIINSLSITNNLYFVLFTAIIISIASQIFKSRSYSFKLNWFIFNFLIYLTSIWVLVEYVLPETVIKRVLLYSLIVGFFITGIIKIIYKINLKKDSRIWISVLLVLVLLAGNFGVVSNSNFGDLFDSSSNSSGIFEEQEECPSVLQGELDRELSEAVFTDVSSMGNALAEGINSSIWNLENNIRSCYQGKFAGQNPNWYYCDDMIVSRWEISSSGTIDYKWYTAISAEWEPIEEKYIFNNFVCESGQKVKVDKETTSYYVHVSRDGTEITIEY